MGRNNIRVLLPFSFCLRRFSRPARSLQIGYPSKSTSFGDDGGGGIELSREYGEKKRADHVAGRRIMVVVDSSREAKAAVQWALSHTVQNQDTLLLLAVIKPPTGPMNGDETVEDRNPKSWELLHALKRFCQVRKPEAEVELSLVEGKERGPTIVEESNRHCVSLLVLGQKKRSMSWRLLKMWASHRRRSNNGGPSGGVVEYCIQNASCMTLGVRRKGWRGGGYLITSRRHKDFWLLA